MRSWIRITGVAGVVVAMLTFASAASATAVGQRTETTVSSKAPDTRVRLTYVRQYQPLLATVGQHPAECDWIGYLRYRSANGPRYPAQAKAVLVAQPGIWGGAASFDAVARNVVAAAAKQRDYVEFWAIDRRSNCLEDHTGVDAAAAARDVRVAFDYYYRGEVIDGQSFAGWKKNADVPFLADFGLAQTVRDEYDVITSRISDPAVRASKVFCGGHSLGGLLTAAFSAWDFDGDSATTADAGYKQCAGYFALDSAVAMTRASLESIPGVSTVLHALGSDSPDVTEAALRSGALPRFVDAAPLAPETMQLLETAAVAAYHQPGTTEFIGDLPHSLGIDNSLRFLFSRDLVTFLSGTPSLRDFRITNEAAFGGLFDDNSEPLGFVGSSLGMFGGRPVAQKDFPTPQDLKDAPGLDAFGGALLSADPLMIPSEPAGPLNTGPLYRWCNYDRIGTAGCEVPQTNAGNPYTSPADEISDVREYARSQFESPTDLTEQYFPNRIVLDIVNAVGGSRTGDLADLRYPAGPDAKPTLAVLAERGGGPGLQRAQGPQTSGRVFMLPGYSHVDVVSAAPRQNNGHPEASSTELTNFALEIIRNPAP